MAKNMIDNNEVQILLKSSKKADLKKAVSIIVQKNLTENLDNLFVILNQSLSDSKMWELNCKIINYLGFNKYKKALPTLEAICKKNETHDMVTAEASKAACRIDRSNNNDVDKVIKYIKFGKFAVTNGALKSLGIDKVKPDINSAEEIISVIKKFEPKQEQGYADVRVGLALACAGWEKNSRVKEFLNSCLDSTYSPLVKIANNSLAGKYSKID